MPVQKPLRYLIRTEFASLLEAWHISSGDCVVTETRIRARSIIMPSIPDQNVFLAIVI